MRRSWTCSAPTSSSFPAAKCPARSRHTTATWPSRPALAPNLLRSPPLDLPDDILAADSVAIHSARGRRAELLPRLPAARGTVQRPRADLPPPLPGNPLRLPGATPTSHPSCCDGSPPAIRPRPARSSPGSSSANAASAGKPTANNCCASTNPATSTAHCCPAPSCCSEPLSSALRRARAESH